MPMPRFVAHINKHLFNKQSLKGNSWSVLTHVGRTSGRTYRTPIESFPIANGFIFVLIYGSESDWVQNVLKSGTAQLQTPDGKSFDLASPRLIAEQEAWRHLPQGAKPPPRILRVTEFLRMDVS